MRVKVQFAKNIWRVKGRHEQLHHHHRPLHHESRYMEWNLITLMDKTILSGWERSRIPNWLYGIQVHLPKCKENLLTVGCHSWIGFKKRSQESSWRVSLRINRILKPPHHTTDGHCCLPIYRALLMTNSLPLEPMMSRDKSNMKPLGIPDSNRKTRDDSTAHFHEHLQLEFRECGNEADAWEILPVYSS